MKKKIDDFFFYFSFFRDSSFHSQMLENQKGVFSIFYYNSTSNEKKLILSVSFICALFSMGIIGIPVWFKKPGFLCSSDSIECEESDYCENVLKGIPAQVSHQVQSLSYELNLFCENQYKKRMMLSWIFFGGLIGCLLNIMIYIRSESRKMVFSILGILYGFCHFGIVFFIDNDLIVSICLMVMAMCIMIGNSYGFTIINEYLSGDLAKSSTILFTLTKGLMGIVFALFCFIINASAKVLFLVLGIPTFILSIFLLIYKNEKGIKDVMRKSVSLFISFQTT